MTRWLRMTAALLLLVILFTACGAPAAPATEPATGETFTDCAGREVSIPDSTERIACLYAYTGHVAVLLGCEDQIVAVVDGLKRDALMQQKIPDIDEMPSPYSRGAINIEELAATAPDMIFLRASNLQDAGEMEKLDGLGIPYAVVEYETMEDQMESIAVMGEALGRQEQAEAYLQYYEDTMDMVRQRLEDLPDSERKTVYHSVNEVVRADIPGTLSYEVLEAAGCRNVVTDAAELQLDGDKGYVTVEQIYVWDPDIILSPVSGLSGRDRYYSYRWAFPGGRIPALWNRPWRRCILRRPCTPTALPMWICGRRFGSFMRHFSEFPSATAILTPF